MFPVECVARGYLTGSGLVDYRNSGAVCGVPLPDGLEDGSRLEQPIFTPATKAEVGDHDENVSYQAVESAVGTEVASELRERTLDIYRTAEEIRSEEHTSELQSLMRISYAVFCLKKKKQNETDTN